MTEQEMLERIQKLERNLATLQSAVVAISVGGAIKINADGLVEAVAGQPSLASYTGNVWTPFR